MLQYNLTTEPQPNNENKMTNISQSQNFHNRNKNPFGYAHNFDADAMLYTVHILITKNTVELMHSDHQLCTDTKLIRKLAVSIYCKHFNLKK